MLPAILKLRNAYTRHLHPITQMIPWTTLTPRVRIRGGVGGGIRWVSGILEVDVAELNQWHCKDCIEVAM